MADAKHEMVINNTLSNIGYLYHDRRCCMIHAILILWMKISKACKKRFQVHFTNMKYCCSEKRASIFFITLEL